MARETNGQTGISSLDRKRVFCHWWQAACGLIAVASALQLTTKMGQGEEV
eukprot:CAMPEP_0174359498 /NCGR_PEP_ID=MMETSP0811_2-20130205/49076_1 /TAXON_ID=73025 ORGANISM="Eutreptiella gymnastica-like, Strain CCMP1594" /NCGR_SAMPLE_ID=MMETSP0811_2 /ASSEMBLY_ACC=CAM_ASM_000667 /LENGTH=49 /DNA_ID=CAMNT_0015494273 /DNA_START=252 /DNA_END=401 /DNA_ORIENTATION=-